jgi:hypothetical protein
MAPIVATAFANGALRRAAAVRLTAVEFSS